MMIMLEFLLCVSFIGIWTLAACLVGFKLGRQVDDKR